MAQALLFLLDAVAGFFGILFLARFFMQAQRVSFAGQFGGFILQLTNWAVKPLRRIIPGALGYDWASLVAAFALQLAYLLLAAVILGHVALLEDGGLIVYLVWGAFRGLLRLIVHLFIGALILQAVLSWVNPYSPLAGPVEGLTRPLLNPIRQVLPTFSGIDLSPLVAILLLQVVLMFL